MDYALGIPPLFVIEFLMFNKLWSCAKKVLFATHRMASVRNADKVLLLKNGKAVDFDTHETFMQANAYLKRL